LVEGLYEVADGEVVAKAPAPFVPLSVALTSSVPIGVGLVCRRVGGQLVCRDVFEVTVVSCP
jgi:hypothetical protein